jgi:hypothetical protein
MTVSTFAYIPPAKCENCECPVVSPNRPANRSDPTDDDLTQSLMEKLLASTRNSISASDLFKNNDDSASYRENRADHAPPDSQKDLAWILILYLMGVIGSLIVAGVWLF